MVSRNRYIGLLFLGLFLLFSCGKGDFDPIDPRGGDGNPTRLPVEQVRHVLVFISGGHNSLSTYMTEDLLDIESAYLPTGTDAGTNALVVLARLPRNSYSTTPAPVLFRMYRNADGAVVKDTLHRFQETDRIFEGNVIEESLNIVRDRLPARSYGLLLSSHASGWLPPGYYDNPSNFERSRVVRSIGQDKDSQGSVEMDLNDFAHALPYEFDYAILDCCLSGCVEVAWELRGKVKKVAFTQSETMADGFDYKTIMSRLLEEPVPNPLGVCQDFYNYYMAKSGVNQSATISLVETAKMDALASVCQQLFSKYASYIPLLNGNGVQGYFRYDRHYFYDLQDIVAHFPGIADEELTALNDALSECIVYKAATPWFMAGTQYGFRIRTHCGLSMYLPGMGSNYLNNYYKTHIAWNEATHLVP